MMKIVKMMNKTKILGIIVIGLLLIGVAVGCGNEATPNEGAESVNAGVGADAGKSFVFKSGDIRIEMNAEAAPILDSLGDEVHYFEAESCAFQGLDRIYTYNGFEVHTYEMEKVEYVAAVMLLDDSVSTKEGIRIDSDIAEVIDVYGDEYTESLGLYSYEEHDSKLVFLVKDEKVIAVEYFAIVDMD